MKLKRLPRLWCAMQGLLPLLPITPALPGAVPAPQPPARKLRQRPPSPSKGGGKFR